MTEEKIAKLFEALGLGKVISPATPVSGGFLHRMYRVVTADRVYAVKCLNPGIMKRPDAMANYKRAESLERILEDAGIPIVPAITINGRKMQEAGGEYFYIFNWHNGRITDWYNITAEQCRQAGSIQGRIHALLPRCVAHAQPELCAIDWQEYIKEADRQNSGIYPVLKENERLLGYAQASVNSARELLPDIECITDEDMDPKNVMWDGDEPVVIDLECLDYGNPVSHALQLSLQWAGITTCSLDPDKQRAFFEGYLASYDNGFRNYSDVLGLAYIWVEWLEYNIRRALGQCQDENERRMGVSEVINTVNRIKHLYEMEDRIRYDLDHMF